MWERGVMIQVSHASHHVGIGIDRDATFLVMDLPVGMAAVVEHSETRGHDRDYRSRQRVVIGVVGMIFPAHRRHQLF